MIDTSVLYVWLKVSGKETCGPSNALVTYEKVSEKIEEEKKKGTTFCYLLQGQERINIVIFTDK